MSAIARGVTRQVCAIPLRVIQRMVDWPDWRYNLLRDSQRPEKQLYSDDLIVILKDHQPKARFHYLVLPKEAAIDNIRQLRPKHIPLLRHMMKKSQEFIDREITPKTANPVLMGFHVIPTFIRLHLHLISQDFDSEFMNSRPAWGSFTTDFFMHPEKAVQLLQDTGRIEIDPVHATDVRGDYRKTLFCRGCSQVFRDLKSLKQHIVRHDLDRPG